MHSDGRAFYVLLRCAGLPAQRFAVFRSIVDLQEAINRFIADTNSEPHGRNHRRRAETKPLPRTARRLASGEPLTIVAIGSSSTAGAGASSPAASYPSRLAITLRQRFPGHPIIVLNRGVNGDDAGDMLNRFENSVVSEKPDLVLWQVGTNSVLHDQAVATLSVLIREGLARLKAIGADVVLIDPQFAPQVLAKPEAEDIVKMMSAAAKEADVDLFTRFAIMRRWREQEGISFDTFVSPDGLHLNDWSYACWHGGA